MENAKACQDEVILHFIVNYLKINLFYPTFSQQYSDTTLNLKKSRHFPMDNIYALDIPMA